MGELQSLTKIWEKIEELHGEGVRKLGVSAFSIHQRLPVHKQTFWRLCVHKYYLNAGKE